MTAEIGLFEMAARIQEDRTRQTALAEARSDAERMLVAAELGATERSLAVQTARATRAIYAAESAGAIGYVSGARPAPPSQSASESGGATGGSRQRNDGVTPEEAATGPSGPVDMPPTSQPPAPDERPQLT